MSAFWEDIKNAGTSVASESMSNVKSYITQTILNAPSLVKIGAAPTGNLSKDQLDAGMRPGVDTYPQGNNNLNGRAKSGQTFFTGSYFPFVLIGGAGILLYFALRK